MARAEKNNPPGSSGIDFQSMQPVEVTLPGGGALNARAILNKDGTVKNLVMPEGKLVLPEGTVTVKNRDQEGGRYWNEADLLPPV